MAPPEAKPAAEDLPIPEEWVSHRADPAKAASWWADLRKLPSVELGCPAADLLAEVRGEDS